MPHPQSDIDIGVCFREKVDYLALGLLQVDLERLLGIRVDLVVLNHLWRRDPLTAFEILSHHRLLHVKEQDRYESFKTHALLSYLDHKPLYDRQEKTLLKRLSDPKTIGQRNYATTH